MSTSQEFDRIAQGFVTKGPTQLADDVLDAALMEIHATPQRHRGRPRWPTAPVSIPSWFASAALIVGLVGLLGYIGLSRSAQPAGLLAGPTVSTMPAPAVLVAPFPAPEAKGSILFTRVDQNTGVFTTALINPDGSNETVLTVPNDVIPGAALGGDACCGVFAPDATRVAIALDAEVVTASGGRTTWTSSMVVRADGSDARPIPGVCTGCGPLPGTSRIVRAWSPDGRLIAIVATGDANPTRDGIWLASASGGPWHQVVTSEDGDAVAFSPDNTRLLYGVRSGSPSEVDLMQLTVASGETTRVSADGTFVTSTAESGIAASWSPDGTQIAFSGHGSGSGDDSAVYVVSSAGGEPRAIISTPGLSGAAWSPDGAWIAFDAPAPSGGGATDIHVVRPDGGDERSLTQDFAPSACCAGWSPDSQGLLAAGAVPDGTNSQLVVIPLSGAPVRQVTTTPGLYLHVAWSPISR